MVSKHTFILISILFYFIVVVTAPVNSDDTVTEVIDDCSGDIFGNCSSSTSRQSTNQFESTTTIQTDETSDVNEVNVTVGTPVSSVVNITSINDIVNTSLTTEQMSDATLEETTLPAATTKLPEPQIKSDEVLRHIPDDVCMCDLQSDSCDINCCCDRDCTEEDRQVFLNCDIKTQHDFSSHFCFRKQHVYRNNTEFKAVVNSDGLFCIYKENLPKEFYLSQKKVFSSTKQMNKEIASKERVDWPSQQKKELKFNSNSTYSASDLIWLVNNSTFLPLSFPSQLFNEFCQTAKPLRYLEPWSGHCVQPLRECDVNINLNAESYFMNLRIIVNPNLLNRTDSEFDIQECPSDVCIPVIPHLCQGIVQNSLKSCNEVEYITKPTIHKNVCKNVVQRIKYIIHHNGTKGIFRVEAFFWLTNITSNFKWFSQEHSVSFTWAGKPRIPIQRSGMPGYIKGKPVMAGHKVYQMLEYDSETGKEAILLDEDNFNWLTLVRGSKDGTCALDPENGNREVVTFGENQQTSCILYLKLTNFSSVSSCSLIQAFILKLLVGDDISNVTDAQQFNKYVATFGDASIENTGEWVQMFLENIPKKTIVFERHSQYALCKNIFTNLHISIAYAYVGSVYNPQAKIVGASLKFGSSHDIVFHCFPVNCKNINRNKTKQIEISSSVSFYDVSTPSKYHFAELPVYEVKLPYDFFYPFLSNKSSKLIENSIISILLLIFLIV